MKAHTASLINGLVLVVMGLWGALATNFNSPTAFIPVGIGFIILLLNNFMKKEDKVISHIIVVLTLLIALALIMPLKRAIETENTMAMVRVILMVLSCLLAIWYFIQSFRAARSTNTNG